MAQGTFRFTQGGVYNLVVGRIDWLENDAAYTIRCMLLNSSYDPFSATNHYALSNLPAGAEVSGTGYTAGGIELAGLGRGITNGGNYVDLVAQTDLLWDPVTVTARYALLVMYHISDPSLSYIIGACDFGQDVVAQAGPFSIDMPTAGILRIDRI